MSILHGKLGLLDLCDKKFYPPKRNLQRMIYTVKSKLAAKGEIIYDLKGMINVQKGAYLTKERHLKKTLCLHSVTHTHVET